jgi:hypothetical protein
MITASHKYIEMIVGTLSDSEEVKIRPGKQWAYDVENNILTYLASDLVVIPFDVVRGIVLHEMGHVMFTVESDRERATVKKWGEKMMHTIDNIYEDVRIERCLKEKYGDFAGSAFDSLNNYAIHSSITGIDGDLTKAPKAIQFAMGNHIDMATYHNHGISIKIGYFPILNQRFGGSYFASYPKGRFPITIDRKVLDRLRQHTLKPGSTDEVDRYSKLVGIYVDCRDAATTAELQSIIDTRLIPLIEDFMENIDVNEKAMALVEALSSKVKAQAGTTKTGREDSYRSERPTVREASAILYPFISTLSQRLLDILKEQQATRFTGAHRSGKLLSKNIAKVATGEERVFSKRIEPDKPKHNIFVGMDRSGSMRPERIESAFMGGVLLTECFKRLGFSIHYYQYGTSNRKLKNLDEYVGSQGEDNNEDKLFMRIAADIKKEGLQEDDNMLFVITDGGTEKSHTFMEGVKALKKVGTTLYGVGIGNADVERCIREVYENGIYSPTLDGLPQSIIKLMRQIIHR